MHYLRLEIENHTIEFHNSWAGDETVLVNGREVSKKFSFWGTHHYFTTMEEGEKVRYSLTTKLLHGMQVAVDLSRNGELIRDNVPVPYGSKPQPPANKAKIRGLKLLKEYDLEAALDAFESALDIEPKDPEIYFNMACAHSVLENEAEGFECLQEAVAFGLRDQERISTHDMLAFLRLHPAFESFRESGFLAVEPMLLEEKLIEYTL